MKSILLSFVLLLSTTTIAQTWSDDVASIFYEKCTKCHNSGGVAPFSLMTYQDVSPMAGIIYDAVSNETMPPWPPNNGYQQYVHNRALDSVQKSTLLSWLLNSFPEGNPANTPPPPVYSNESVLGSGDLTLQIPTYKSKAMNGQDDYVCFAVPTGLTQQRVIRAVEVIPGNREIVHHALIYIDPSASSPTDTTGGDCATPNSASAVLVGGYTPGSTPMVFPSSAPMKLGMPIQAGANIVFAMHYPDGSFGEMDSTKVIFHFYPPNETGIRTVSAGPLIQNWSFNLPANQYTNVTATYPTSGSLNADYTLLSVFPHMHLIGESISNYALKSNGDTIPIIDVPHWDFHWQDFYFFKNALKLPVGTKLKAFGRYNNTSSNPHNPYNPPQNVGAGLNTNDEMFLIYYHYMPYQNGDETYDMEELMSASVEDIAIEKNDFLVYPNPSNGAFNFELPKQAYSLKVHVYNHLGQLVAKKQGMNVSKFDWDGKNAEGSLVTKGIYYVSINADGVFLQAKIIKL